MTERIARTKRRAGVRVVLGSRDEALLRAVGRFRLCRTSDLLELFFQGVRKDTALRRLRRLYDAGFLETRVLALHQENLLALGAAGRRHLERQGVGCMTAPQGGEAHHLAIIQAWTRLAGSLHYRPGVRLWRFTPDWELRRDLAGSDPRFVPDAMIELVVERSGSSASERWALEVDLGSERVGELRKKLLAYRGESAIQDGTLGLAVVLSGKGVSRRRVVTDLVHELWPWPSVVCLESEWPEMYPPLRNRIADPLTASPSGEGRSESATPSENDASVSQGERHLR
jgi:Replication-relaxation